MKQIHLAFAGVAALAVSAQAGESPWWSEDFSAYEDIAALTNQLAGVRTSPDSWVTEEGDNSSIVIGAYSNEYKSAYYSDKDVDFSDVLKLDTEGNDLVFVPREYEGEPQKKVVVDADIFFVGSDTPPTGFDDNEDVQFALYLKTPSPEEEEEGASNVLSAYVYDQESSSAGWVDLSGVAVDNFSWHHVQVLIDYGKDIRTLSIFIDGTEVTGENVQLARNRTRATKLNSVSFRGTGAIDNFVGQYVLPAPEHTFQAAIYENGEEVANDGIISEFDAEAGIDVEFEIPVVNNELNLSKVVIKNLAGGADTVYEFAYDEENDEWSVSPEADNVDLQYLEYGVVVVTAPTDGAATDGEAKTYTLVEAYYGEAVEPPPSESHVGAKSENGIVILDSSDEAAAGQGLEFTSITIDGTTATVGFDAAVLIPEGADTTITLPLLSAQSLEGPWTPVSATVTVTEEGGTAVVNLPEDAPALFFKGFTNAEGVLDDAE